MRWIAPVAGVALIAAGAGIISQADVSSPVLRSEVINPDGIVYVDGDTIRLGAERIRLNGIDAPEMPGHCRPGRRCVEGDPERSRALLVKGVIDSGGGEVRVNRLKRDRYGRTVAQVTIGGVDLSCRQVSLGAAVYVPRWDEGRIMEGSCE